MAEVFRYNPSTALFLAQVCALTYHQYQQGRQNVDYDGMITPPAGYRQIAAFKAPEICFKQGCHSNHLHPSALNPEKDGINDIQALESAMQFIQRTFFGFALDTIDGSGNGIIAFRGTESPYEWIMDTGFIQAELPSAWVKDKNWGTVKAHLGFLSMYVFLKDQILKVARQFSNSGICYITGHSLGAALAILAALTISQIVFREQTGKVQMYNFAGPRVGDPVFANLYNQAVPFSYRIVNLADIVPVLPPAKILNYHYQHIGMPNQRWEYLHQTGDIADNHSLENNYLPALAAPSIGNFKFINKY